MKILNHRTQPAKPSDLDLDDLLHPAQAFEHPRDVANDPDLTINEKRAILASWASDACAVEAAPALRCAPGASFAVSVDDILEALRTLDKATNGGAPHSSWARRQIRRRSLEQFRLRRAPRSGWPRRCALRSPRAAAGAPRGLV
jgi:hypothetical protein